MNLHSLLSLQLIFEPRLSLRSNRFPRRSLSDSPLTCSVQNSAKNKQRLMLKQSSQNQ